MHIEQEKQGDNTVLHIIGDMTIYDAPELKETLLNTLAQANNLEINLADVSDMDTAGFQILVLLKREALEKNKTLRLSAHSPVVIEVIDTYHMAAYFGDPLIVSEDA